MIKRDIQKKLDEALRIAKQNYSIQSGIEIASNPAFGDYATNLAFLLAKELKSSPKNIAEKICEELSKIPQIDVSFKAINGFINISLSQDFLWEKACHLLNNPLRFNASQEPILLEYVSANPTGPLHIGHGRWAVLGSALANLLRFVGMKVNTEFYINDSGNQIRLFYETIQAIQDKRPIPEGGYHGQYMTELAQAALDPLESNILQQKKILGQIDVSFDLWYSEKSLHESGKAQVILDLLKEKNASYTEEGALWFKSSDYGDEKDRVLIKADGHMTYFLVDLAYHYDKVVSRGYTRLINIWGADHHGYVPRVRAGLIALCGVIYKEPHHFKVMIGQLVNLLRNGEPVRMSKRTGDMITLEEVIEDIGKDATRYFLIEKNPDSHIEFDLELAKKNTMENPVYYIQYAYARMCSILSKVTAPASESLSMELCPEERALLLANIRFEDEVWEAAELLSPYRVAHYAVSLARTFHSFYEKCSLIQAPPDVQGNRIVMLKLTQKTLGHCFDILGISAPTKM